MRKATKFKSIELKSCPLSEERLIIKVVSIKELGDLLKVYQRVKGKPILIAVRDLERLVVTAVGTEADAVGLVSKLGGDGWLVLTPDGAIQSIPSGIKVYGEIRKKVIRGRFDGTRLHSARSANYRTNR